jgi:hypothetical protein
MISNTSIQDKTIFGTILKSTSHILYVAQALNPHNEVFQKGMLASFVLIDGGFVGLIYDTELYNANSITLSQQKETVPVFAPDIHDDVDLMLKIALIGELKDGFGLQELPQRVISPGAKVSLLSEEQLKNFHLSSQKFFQLKYFSSLKSSFGESASRLFPPILKKLSPLIQEDQRTLFKAVERVLLSQT